jgi:hypothetical protein
MEMDLYFAYLSDAEEAKKAAQPWQCEVTTFPPADEGTAPAKPRFVCDEPE